MIGTGSVPVCLAWWILQPSGQHLMEDFFYAGGVPVVLRELGEAGVLNREALTANGHSIWENVGQAECWNREVIRTFAEPFKAHAGHRRVRGNLAPNGAVIKPSAASDHLLLQHRGRAVVFENVEELHSRINDESLDIDENCVMVLKNCGPRGYPGNGGSWEHADPAQTAAQGSHGHGPRFGCAHERHGLRNRRSSRVSGSRRRWTPGPGACG